jgi:hypothetical protein
MRLPITSVLLIGAMVVTAVTGDPEIKKGVVKLRLWFGKTVKRLESGQTVTQNQQFINLAIDYTDHLLAILSYQSAVYEKQVFSGTPYLEVDGKLIHRIEDIQNEVVPPDDRPKANMKHVLEAIKQVLRGNFQSARDAIEVSKSDLPDSTCSPSEQLELGSMNREVDIPNYEVVSRPDTGVPLQLDHTEGEPSQSSFTLPTGFSQHTMTQIGTIRNWIALRLTAVHDYYEYWVARMMRFVSEIAYAVINSLPNKYVPHEESRFIGRVPVEERGVVAGRIYPIETHINEMDQRRIDPIALTVRDVLQAIREILGQDWRTAKTVMDRSRLDRPYLVSAEDAHNFDVYTHTTYGL